MISFRSLVLAIDMQNLVICSSLLVDKFFKYMLKELLFSMQFILEQLCNLICPSKPEAVYLLILNKAHTQEEFIRGSMTKNPYSSAEIGPLMRDVKNKICHQLDLLGLLEDDYGMELLVAGNIISLDLSISQVYEQVWKKSNNQSSNALAGTTMLSSGGTASSRDCPPMTVTYRLQVWSCGFTSISFFYFVLLNLQLQGIYVLLYELIDCW